MPDWEAENESEHDVSVVTETQKEVKKPPLYMVLLHNVDYTTMEHHEDIPDSADTGDPSRPQGEFWHRNERPGAEAIESVKLDESTNEKPR